MRAQYAGLGRQIVVRAFERGGKKFSEDKLRQALPRLARASIEDVLAAVGRGEMFSGDVVQSVYPDFKEERKPTPANPADPGWFGMQKATGVQFKVPGAPEGAHALPIRGLRGDQPVNFAPNGGAVPGDRIVGIMTPGEGITIYPIQSPSLAAFDDQPERWLDVRWDVADPRELFPAKIIVAAINEPGSLGSVAGLIGEQGGNIDDVKFNKKSPDFREMILEIQVFDLKHLTDIVSRLRALPIVHKVERVIG